MAGRHRVWSASARELARAEEGGAGQVSDPRLPGHHPQLRCQYPVPDWDVAYALTEGREVINPRPVDESAIFHAIRRSDDRLHHVFRRLQRRCQQDRLERAGLGSGGRRRWTSCGNTAAISSGSVRADADSFAHGLLALEQNWRGPLLTNTSVETTLQRFRTLEQRVKPSVLLNWRFQQALYRAYYDAFLRSRLIYETGLEEQALSRLRMARARVAAGDGPGPSHPRPGDDAIRSPAICRSRIFALAEALFQSIRMQMSVPRYKAIADRPRRDPGHVDNVLNNRIWLERRFDPISKLESEESRLKEIDAIVNWTNPGPGGFHDDLGDPRCRPHLVTGLAYEKDPAALARAADRLRPGPSWRRTWCRHAGRSMTSRSNALHWARPRCSLQAPRRLHRRYVPGEGAADGERIDRGASVLTQAQRHEAARIRHPPRGDAHRGLEPELARRVGRPRQWTRLPGGRGVADQEVALNDDQWSPDGASHRFGRSFVCVWPTWTLERFTLV